MTPPYLSVQGWGLMSDIRLLRLWSANEMAFDNGMDSTDISPWKEEYSSTGENRDSNKIAWVGIEFNG